MFLSSLAIKMSENRMRDLKITQKMRRKKILILIHQRKIIRNKK